MAAPAVRVEDWREFKRDLKRMDKEVRQGFEREMKEMAEESAMDARGAAQGGTRQQARAAYNIVGSGKRAGGSIAITGGNDLPYALGAFWGSKRPQFPGLPWVGSSWEAGVHGQGPYFMNDAVADHADDIEDQLGDMTERAARISGAFPT